MPHRRRRRAPGQVRAASCLPPPRAHPGDVPVPPGDVAHPEVARPSATAVPATLHEAAPCGCPLVPPAQPPDSGAVGGGPLTDADLGDALLHPCTDPAGSVGGGGGGGLG